MHSHLKQRRRSGVTLLEMVVSMSIFLVVLSLATKLLVRQNALQSAQTGRLEAQGNAMFGLAVMERELRVAGIGVVDVQPILVQADSLAITFNADLVARDTAGIGAVYIDGDADSSSTLVYKRADRLLLPRSGTYYPESTYTKAAGVPGAAETISFWLGKDSTAKTTFEYILWRRVNADPAQVVAKGIYIKATDTVFQYFKGDTAGRLTVIPQSALPIYHPKPYHGSAADTGQYADIDQIKAVKIRFTAIFHDRNNIDAKRRMEMTIRLMNAGLVRRSECGNPPISVTPVAVVTPADGIIVLNPFVTITWPKSFDEGGGEKDVERYAVYRRLASVTDFSEPQTSVPATAASTYSYKDTDVITGQQWIYGVTAQDCTPKTSSIGAASSVTIP